MVQLLALLTPAVQVVWEAELAAAAAWYDEAILGSPAAAPPVPSVTVVRQDHARPCVNTSVWGTTPICIGTTVFERGIGTHANSEFVVRLPSPGRMFQAKVGVDNNYDTAGKRGTVAFAVRVGEVEVASTPVLRCGEAPLALEAPLNGVTEFALLVTDGGDGVYYDQCDWAEARVELESGEVIWLDEMPLLPAPGPIAEAPFSFTYGGLSSRDLLASWPRSVETKRFEWGRLDRISHTDPETGLVVTCEAKLYSEFPAAEWLLTFENAGAERTPILEHVRALDMAYRGGWPKGFRLHHSTGSICTAEDFIPRKAELKRDAPVRLASRGGRSSDGSLPFFNLEWGTGGAVVAVGWSGQWAAEAACRGDDEATVTAGMETLRCSLLPGERIRTPRMLAVHWQGDDVYRGHNLLRRLILAHYSPRINGELVLPPIAGVPAANELNDATEENQLAQIPDIAEAGLEAFWLDAGWFVGMWPMGTGSWDPRPETFPRGLRPLGDAAHHRGLKFVLWFEPERVSPGSWIATQHPEWVLHVGDGTGQGLFNLANPQARQWLADYLSERIEAWGVDVYRNDFNIEPLPFWQAADEPDRTGITEIRYIEGLYALWDELLARHPGLAIDNCASGGRRIDLELLSRSYPLWRSDVQCFGNFPACSQAQTAGLSLYVPLHAAGVRDFTTYEFRSTATTGVAYVPVHIATGVPVEMAKQRADEVKRLRPYWLGDYYPLLPVNTDETQWCAMQFNRPEEGDGMVLLFRRPESGYVTAELTLRGLEANATYEVVWEDEGRTELRTGAELARLRATVEERPAAVLMTYRRVSARADGG